MDTTRLVSVVIPVYNCERYLAEAIDSVLTQTFRPIEIVVVDDGSTDASGAIAKGYDSDLVRYSYQRNSGACAARNRGVELVRGTFLAFLDSDDVWLPEKLSLQMTAIECETDLDMVFGLVTQFYSPELDPPLEANAVNDQEVLPGYCPGTMLIRRDVFARVGPFDTQLRIGEFVDWYSKAVDKGLKSIVIPKILMKRRIHGNNTGIRDRESRTDYVRILKRTLDRRREQGL